jgi:uncharacterized protein YbjT (DUF2867 family)
MIAALFGSTGLVGSEVLDLLERDSSISKIHVFARRAPAKSGSPKIVFHLSDLTSVDTISAALKITPPDFALCCLGTTMARAGSREEFYRIDHDLIMNVGHASRNAGIRAFGVISSLGTRIDAGAFYLRVKAETERDLANIGFPSLVVLRPSVILGHREADPITLRVLVTLSGGIAPLFRGPLTRYRPVAARTTAARLIEFTRSAKSGVTVIENETMLRSL